MKLAFEPAHEPVEIDRAGRSGPQLLAARGFGGVLHRPVDERSSQQVAPVPDDRSGGSGKGELDDPAIGAVWAEEPVDDLVGQFASDFFLVVLRDEVWGRDWDLANASRARRRNSGA